MRRESKYHKFTREQILSFQFRFLNKVAEKCYTCGDYGFFRIHRFKIGKIRLCQKCHAINLEIRGNLRLSNKLKRENLERLEKEAKRVYKEERRREINEQIEGLYRCSLKGACTCLKAHHTLLKDDPERLTTAFLMKVIGVNAESPVENIPIG